MRFCCICLCSIVFVQSPSFHISFQGLNTGEEFNHSWHSTDFPIEPGKMCVTSCPKQVSSSSMFEYVSTRFIVCIRDRLARASSRVHSMNLMCLHTLDRRDYMRHVGSHLIEDCAEGLSGIILVLSLSLLLLSLGLMWIHRLRTMVRTDCACPFCPSPKHSFWTILKQLSCAYDQFQSFGLLGVAGLYDESEHKVLCLFVDNARQHLRNPMSWEWLYNTHTHWVGALQLQKCSMHCRSAWASRPVWKEMQACDPGCVLKRGFRASGLK